MNKEELVSNKGWINIGNMIEKEFVFKDFVEAIGFIVKAGLLAEKADHHPELWNSYNKVKVQLTTHSSGGLTEKDFDLALKIEQI